MTKSSTLKSTCLSSASDGDKIRRARWKARARCGGARKARQRMRRCARQPDPGDEGSNTATMREVAGPEPHVSGRRLLLRALPEGRVHLEELQLGPLGGRELQASCSPSVCMRTPVVVAGGPLLFQWELDVSLAHSLSTILFPPSLFSC